MASPRWLTHHDPEHQDRCVHVGPVLVCGRCLVLYPLVVATAVATVLVDLRPGPATVLAMWLLPLPMVAEWVGEHLGALSYRPWRQRALTALAAPAFGFALGEHLRHPFSAVAVLPVLVYVAICVVSALWGLRRDGQDDGWEARHEQAEADRRRELEALLSSQDEQVSRR
ncbi:MAG: hypothetical protein ACYC2O_12720 [Microthrixaceae bacterium]